MTFPAPDAIEDQRGDDGQQDEHVDQYPLHAPPHHPELTAANEPQKRRDAPVDHLRDWRVAIVIGPIELIKSGACGIAGKVFLLVEKPQSFSIVVGIIDKGAEATELKELAFAVEFTSHLFAGDNPCKACDRSHWRLLTDSVNDDNRCFAHEFPTSRS